VYRLLMAHAGWSVEVQAAEDYERFLVPALIDVWAPRMLEAARVGERDTVLDVACGTGIVARRALAAVGVHGRVVGLDATEAMLTVAQRIEPRGSGILGMPVTCHSRVGPLMQLFVSRG
jgi:2-polyprenyl-3-methyl-5-hydroxy-6-metoxy-1,4-benzoquinol methylase